MSLLQAYLKNSRTQKILNRKPGEKGFSLIELVVVIAVLAVLIVIALPGFQGVTDDAAVSAGKKFLVDAFTECTVYRTRNIADGEVNIPAINGGNFEDGDGGDADNPYECPDEDGELLVYDPALDTIPVFSIDMYTGEKTCDLGADDEGEGGADDGAYNCTDGEW